MNKAVISRVVPASPAAKAGVLVGDILSRINGKIPRDIIDYQLISEEEKIELEVVRKGKVFVLALSKRPHEKLGLKFHASIFNRIKTCTNDCLFCFIDQNPPRLRRSLYVKDDDYRLSFLYGNFISLTNMTEEDIQRVIDQRLSPLYVSLHTTDPVLHRKILGIKKKDQVLSNLKKLLEAGIAVHVQIVLCPDINDGEALEKTIEQLEQQFPETSSIGVVPVGITAYQKNDRLRPFEPGEIDWLIEWTEKKRKRSRKKKGKSWVFLADEFFLRTGRTVPGADYYEDFPQLENGIGLVRLFLDELEEGIIKLKRSKLTDQSLVILTGEMFAPTLKRALDRVKCMTGLRCEAVPVRNKFFGGHVSVAGLLTTGDIISHFQVAGYPLDSKIHLIPDTMLNQDGRFLDGYTPEDLMKTVNHDIQVVPGQGAGFVDWLCREGK